MMRLRDVQSTAGLEWLDQDHLSENLGDVGDYLQVSTLLFGVSLAIASYLTDIYGTRSTPDATYCPPFLCDQPFIPTPHLCRARLFVRIDARSSTTWLKLRHTLKPGSPFAYPSIAIIADICAFPPWIICVMVW